MFAHQKSDLATLSLKNINTYIERHIRIINQKENLDSDDEVIKAVLMQILTTIQPGDVPDSPQVIKKKIAIALHYIGALPVERGNFLTGKNIVSYSNVFKEERGFGLTFDKEIYTNLQTDLNAGLLYYPPPLTGKKIELLTYLCDALIKHNQKPVWEYQYQVDGSGKVSNDMVDDWQRDMAHPSSDDNESYRDFRRDSKIMGENLFKSDEAVTAAIKKMMISAKGYSAEEKVKLYLFMQQKAGQRINYIFNAMAAQNELGEWKPAILKAVDVNWYVGKDGKIHLNYDVVVGAFANDKGEFLVGKPDGSVIATENPELLPKLSPEEVPPPVLRVSVRAELRIEDGEVVPRITHIYMGGCSDRLTSPSHKYEMKVAAQSSGEIEPKV